MGTTVMRRIIQPYWQAYWEQGIRPWIARAFPGSARHRWLIAGIALFATSTIAAIQRDPADNTSLDNEIVLAVPQEIVQIPAPEEGMQAARRSPATISGMYSPIAGATNRARQWQHLVIQRGDRLAALLESRQLLSQEVSHTLNSSAATYALHNLMPGRTLMIAVDTDGQLKELAYELGDDTTLQVIREDDGSYSTHHEKRQYTTRRVYKTAVIEDSLFAAGKVARMSDRLIMDLAGIFGWDIDFALDLRRGDQFSVIYEEKYWRGEKIEDGHIVAAEFVNRGHHYRAVAHQDENGVVRFYSPSGHSLQRQFLKTPVHFSRISSRYTQGRYHPILKRWRAHTGVDYAAAKGTPVRATATGRILSRGRKGGYGKTVVIRHGGKYSTLYAHLSGYQRGQRAGSLVKQGEVIGYVGNTGLATGPHLHYEFRVYGHHRNPLTVTLPRSHPVGDEQRSAFLQTALSWSTELDRISGQLQVAQNTR